MQVDLIQWLVHCDEKAAFFEMFFIKCLSEFSPIGSFLYKTGSASTNESLGCKNSRSVVDIFRMTSQGILTTLSRTF